MITGQLANWHWFLLLSVSVLVYPCSRVFWLCEASSSSERLHVGVVFRSPSQPWQFWYQVSHLRMTLVYCWFGKDLGGRRVTNAPHVCRGTGNPTSLRGTIHIVQGSEQFFLSRPQIFSFANASRVVKATQISLELVCRNGFLEALLTFRPVSKEVCMESKRAPTRNQ